MRKSILKRLTVARDNLQGVLDELTNIAETATLKDDEHEAIDEVIERATEARDKLNDQIPNEEAT